MKLYAFKPDDWGPLSYYVIAETEEEARKAVEEFRARIDDTDKAWPGSYSMTIAERGDVIPNDNS